MSDYSRASINQIPNIGYCSNSYFINPDQRQEISNLHDYYWKGYGVDLAPFDPTNKYRKANFPSGWTYEPDKNDKFNRHGWYVDVSGNRQVEVFMKDSAYSVGCRIDFINLNASV
jgi:hypothetical protein